VVPKEGITRRTKKKTVGKRQMNVAYFDEKTNGLRGKAKDALRPGVNVGGKLCKNGACLEYSAKSSNRCGEKHIKRKRGSRPKCPRGMRGQKNGDVAKTSPEVATQTGHNKPKDDMKGKR